MWKVLSMMLFLTSSILSADSIPAKINSSGINFQKDITEETITIFYEMAVSEYEYSNFGYSRDLLTAIIQKSNKQPGAYFFLGKIYEEVAQFKNIDMSKQCYLNAAVNKNLNVGFRQQSYLALIRLTDSDNLAIKYATASAKIAISNESKQAFVLAYHKKYEKTGDEELLSKADALTRQMNEQYFNGSDITNNTEQVNLTK